MSERESVGLSHVDSGGGVRWGAGGVNPRGRRGAGAGGGVGWRRVRAARLGSLPKGDALATARIAGIMAAKRTADLIPLCHPLPLTHLEVTVTVGEGRADVEATAETTARTGVEMEALVAASVAALALYDMAKAVDKEMVVEEVRLLEKTKEEPGA